MERFFINDTHGTFIKVNNEKDLEDLLLFLFSNNYPQRDIESECKGSFPKYVFIWNPSYDSEKIIAVHAEQSYMNHINDKKYALIKWSDDLFKELNRKPIEEIEINLKKLEDKFK